MMKKIAGVFVAAGLLAGGCANVATVAAPPTDPNAVGYQEKIVRTGSNIPVRDRARGPELMRIHDAQRDKQATRQMVEPLIPLIGN